MCVCFTPLYYYCIYSYFHLSLSIEESQLRRKVNLQLSLISLSVSNVLKGHVIFVYPVIYLCCKSLEVYAQNQLMRKYILLNHIIPFSHSVNDVEGSILVASSDVISEQCVASAVCISRLDSGHRGVYRGTLAHTGVVRQVQEDGVVVVDV